VLNDGIVKLEVAEESMMPLLDVTTGSEVGNVTDEVVESIELITELTSEERELISEDSEGTIVDREV